MQAILPEYAGKTLEIWGNAVHLHLTKNPFIGQPPHLCAVPPEIAFDFMRAFGGRIYLHTEAQPEWTRT